MKPLLLILALAVSASAQRSDLGINVSYDRFRDESVVKLTESLMPDRPGYVLLSFVVTTKGKDLQHVRPKSATLVIHSYTDEWYFLKTNNTLRIIQDGERYEIGKLDIVDSEVLSSGVTELLAREVPFTTIEKLSQASKLEIQVGRYEAEIKPDAVKNIKRWVAWFTKTPD